MAERVSLLYPPCLPHEYVEVMVSVLAMSVTRLQRRLSYD